jgi:hypothetical protein
VALTPEQAPAPEPAPLTLVEDADGVDFLLRAIPVGRYVARPTTDAFESPRPYVHPLRTAGGVELSDFRPADHLWHHGLALGVPSVGSSNLWGGRSWDSCTADYLDKGDNGTMRTDHVGIEAGNGRIVSRVTWLGANDVALADEQRTIRLAEAAEGCDGCDGWTLDWSSRIRALTELRLGSPASYGRAGAGYGGVFLRAAPAFRGARARTDRRPQGPADELLGTTARWLAMTRADGAATVVLGTPQDTTWFVRSEEYPGFGPAPFFGDEVALAPGERLELSVRLWAVDGEPSVDEIEKVFAPRTA